MTRCHLMLAFWICSLALSAAAQESHSTPAAEKRTWRFVFRGEARSFVGSLYYQENGVVVLDSAHTRRVMIPIEAFMAEDQTLLRQSEPKNKGCMLMFSHPVINPQGASLLPVASTGARLWITVFLCVSIASLMFGRSFQNTITGLKARLITVLLTGSVMMLLLLLTSCRPEGCTDASAINYNIHAKVNDGSCIYQPLAGKEAKPLKLSALKEAFEPFEGVSTFYDQKYFYVESHGLPDHAGMMVGITKWLGHVPTPQHYFRNDAWRIPRKPVYADNPLSIEHHFQGEAIAIAVNGIPVFNPINASGKISREIGELDAYGGHCGHGDDYHYHTAPLHLQQIAGNGPIAFALDGFAIYGAKEPDGSPMGVLDEHHGHEWNGTYHYHGTMDYPYMIASMRGKVAVHGTPPKGQITTQPEVRSFRGDPHRIDSDNLIIISCTKSAHGQGYTIEYIQDGLQGSMSYSWDENNLYTFTFFDVDGQVTRQTFQRDIP